MTTDFGMQDYYVSMLKGAMLQAVPTIRFTDITHMVKPYDIVQGAFVLKNAFDSFPAGTLHLITVNNRPEPTDFIAFRHQDHYFIGPDNGIFSLMFEELPPTVHRFPTDPFHSFPLKKLLASGVSSFFSDAPFSSVDLLEGKPVTRIALQPVISTSQIRGAVIYIDHYENAIVNIRRDLFDKVRQGRPFQLFFKRHDPVSTLSSHYGDVPVGETLCLFNSAGFLEIAIHMGKASSMLGLSLDDMVQVDFS
jgi:S-adenosylmethionine hydrolase